MTVLLYGGARLAFDSPPIIEDPQITLTPSALPWYTLLSVGRMLAAYILSLVFTLNYGRAAAYNRRAKSILMPLLDVLQSVPILSFLPIVLLGLSAFLSQRVAAELASIVLIFTSQAWNMTSVGTEQRPISSGAGGSWYSLDDFIRTTNRNGIDPIGWSIDLGFRCSRSP